MCKPALKIDICLVEFSEWTGNLLFMRENVALNFNRSLRTTNVLRKMLSTRKVLLSGNQPLGTFHDLNGNFFMSSSVLRIAAFYERICERNHLKHAWLPIR